MKVETFAAIIFFALSIGVILFSENISASPWDDGFKGPVAEPTKIDCKKEKCA